MKSKFRYEIIINSDRESIYYTFPRPLDWLRETIGPRGTDWDLTSEGAMLRRFRFTFMSRSVARRFELYCDLHGHKVIEPTKKIKQ